MHSHQSFLLFSIGQRHYALAISEVARVLPAAQTTPVQDMPRVVRGLINIGGEILPVVDIRILPDQEIVELDPDDRFILTRAEGIPMALLATSVDGVQELAEVPIPLPLNGDSGPSGPDHADRKFQGTTTVATVHGQIVHIRNMRLFVQDLASLTELAGEAGLSPDSSAAQASAQTDSPQPSSEEFTHQSAPRSSEAAP